MKKCCSETICMVVLFTGINLSGNYIACKKNYHIKDIQVVMVTSNIVMSSCHIDNKSVDVLNPTQRSAVPWLVASNSWRDAVATVYSLEITRWSFGVRLEIRCSCHVDCPSSGLCRYTADRTRSYYTAIRREQGHSLQGRIRHIRPHQ